MREYDRSQPLIFIHLPKTAGTTSREIFQNWFGEGFLKHYYDGRTESLPIKHDIFDMHSTQKPIMVCGHFNKSRGFGIEDYYPNVKQFITILRDPFEQEISRYFYTRKNHKNLSKDIRFPQEPLEEYLLNTKPNMLVHFPRETNLNNYKDIIEEYFIDIGITEHLEYSMQSIANKLNFPYNPSMLGHLNTTPRDQSVSPHLKDMFIEKHQLEFAIYNYVSEKIPHKDLTNSNNERNFLKNMMKKWVN